MLINVHTIHLMAVSLIPLGVYLLVLGFINVSGWPLVVRGAWDTFWLAAAVSGLLVTGVISLFFEATPLYRFYRLYPWLPWATYAALAVLWVMRDRNRIILYCVAPVEVERLLEKAASLLGQELRRSANGNVLALHPSEVALTVRAFDALECATVIVSDPEAVKPLHRALRKAVREVVGGIPRPRWSLPGVVFTFAGTVLVAYPTVWLIAINANLLLRLLPE